MQPPVGKNHTWCCESTGSLAPALRCRVASAGGLKSESEGNTKQRLIASNEVHPYLHGLHSTRRSGRLAGSRRRRGQRRVDKRTLRSSSPPGSQRGGGGGDLVGIRISWSGVGGGKESVHGIYKLKREGWHICTGVSSSRLERSEVCTKSGVAKPTRPNGRGVDLIFGEADVSFARRVDRRGDGVG